MKREMLSFVAMLVLVAGWPLAASAQTCPDPDANGVVKWAAADGGNSHSYQLVNFTGAWVDARNDAKTHVLDDGTPADLATITSSQENAFIANCVLPTKYSQYWIGGFQDPNASVGAGWHWINDEGDIPPTNAGPGYANWASGEPNGSGDHLAIYSGKTLGGTWNDNDSTKIKGYVAEYGPVTVSAAKCQSSDGCQPFSNVKYKLPPDTKNVANNTITFDIKEFNQPCDGKAHSYFGGGFLIPGYLCGDFVGIKTSETGELKLTSSTVTLVDEKGDVVCDEPLPSGTDPESESTVVYQSIDPNEMLENGVVVGKAPFPQLQNYDEFYNFPGGVGSAAETTYKCGSAWGRGASLSFYAFGLKVHFQDSSAYDPNDPSTWLSWSRETDRDTIKGDFVALTIYKLDLLDEAVQIAENAGVLNTLDANHMQGLIQAVIADLRQARWQLIDQVTDNLVGAAEGATYNPPNPDYNPDFPDYNYQGNILMRLYNAQFMLKGRIVPMYVNP